MLRKLFQGFAVLASALAFAEPAIPQTSEEVAVGSRYAARTGEMMQQNNMQQQKFVPCCRNINPSARGCPGNCGFFVTADFLWWRADENDLPYAFVQNQTGPFSFTIADAGFNNSVTTFTETIPTFGYVANINYRWRPGFRVGIGWNTPHDGWDTSLEWTWYRNSSIDSVHQDMVLGTVAGTGTLATGVVKQGVTPPSPIPEQVTPIWSDSARAHWTLLFNMIDWELGRAFYVSEGLSLRPFASVRGGWINRKFIVEQGNPNLGGTDFSVAFEPSTFFAKNNYWGVGPRFGLNTDWRFCGGWMLYGNMAASILYGHVFRNFETVNDFASFVGASRSRPLLASNITNKKHVWRAVPNTQVAFGFGWGDCVNCNSMFFSIRLGWEASFFWNMQNFVLATGNLAGLSAAHSLSLVGATLSAKLDF
ncbi:MAG TPA: Lpg1974 family pore-forming outer membrane protein [Chlamydiales bacterium]|nr:Lpg1974 family pore-forming outer membrane protein [Chlamydiales bacterium]